MVQQKSQCGLLFTLGWIFVKQPLTFLQFKDFSSLHISRLIKMETTEDTLQIFTICESVEEKREVVTSAEEEDSVTNSPAVASSGPDSKPNRVRQPMQVSNTSY